VQNNKIIFLFSGQGSQYRGMGGSLFKNNPVFRHSLQKSDGIVRKKLGRSLIEELYFNDDEDFEDLLITHPAIVAIEIAMWEVVQEMGINPDYVAGHSLGEFAAGVASGVWSAETAVEAALEQAQAIVEKDIRGGMISIIANRNKSLDNHYRRHYLFLASDNFHGHFTLSGLRTRITLFETDLKNMNIPFVSLPVAFPFHSPLMEGRSKEFESFMARISLSNPNAGFVSGTEGRELTRLSNSYFWDLIHKYTNFTQIVELLERKGPCIYLDLGPSGTCGTFVKYNLKQGSESKTFQIMNLYKREDEQLRNLRKLFSLRA
jgi:bacillaene synthase trans-acting acyltransferase